MKKNTTQTINPSLRLAAPMFFSFLFPVLCAVRLIDLGNLNKDTELKRIFTSMVDETFE